MKNNFDIKDLAKDWNNMFVELIDNKIIHPINEYQPTKQYIIKNNEIRLNIAAGPNVFPFDGWINYDHENFVEYFNFLNSVQTSNGMPEHQIKLWKWLKDGGKLDFRSQDMCVGFPQHNDNSITAIYVGQAIEHLSPVHQVPAFLKECHRMLKPGGVIRLTTPDLDLLLNAYKMNQMNIFDNDQPEFYKTANPAMQLAYLMFGSCGSNCSQKNYEGHMCLFNKDSLMKELENAGFSKIYLCKEHDSNDLIMAQQVKDEGISHSIIMEAVK